MRHGVASEENEVALIRQMSAGDPLALATLYREYYPRLIRFIGRTIRCPNLVEEILNDTMLVVWRKAQTFDATSKVSTWIFGIAYRKAIKALKRVDDPVEPNPEGLNSWSRSEPEDKFMQEELRAHVNRTMARLSAEHRDVIKLAYYQDCNYREIAEIMKCPIETVKTRMFYARRKLGCLLIATEGSAIQRYPRRREIGDRLDRPHNNGQLS